MIATVLSLLDWQQWIAWAAAAIGFVVGGLGVRSIRASRKSIEVAKNAVDQAHAQIRMVEQIVKTMDQVKVQHAAEKAIDPARRDELTKDIAP